MLAATIARWKWEAVKKSEREHVRPINVKKKCAARAKLLLLIRPIVAFYRFPALHAFAA